MTNGSHLEASVRILELNLADAMQRVYDSKKLPVEIKTDRPRPGGLCAGIFDALGRRTDNPVDGNALFARNILTLFAREKKIIYDSSVAGRDVFVVLDFALPDNRTVSPEFFLLANALGTDAYVSLAQQAGQAAKLNGAASVHLIMPTYAYARQDKDHGERGPISASITAQNLEPYYDSVTCVHLHSQAIKGMFRAIPLSEISPNEIYALSFVCRDPGTFRPLSREALTPDGVNALLSQLCVVSPDAGGAKNARDFAKYVKRFAASLLDIEEQGLVDIPMAQIDKRRSAANVSEVIDVLGKENVAGRVAVIVDDMGDTFGTGVHAANALVEAGAKTVEFWGTHGYFSGEALARIAASPIARVSITNSMALRPEIAEAERVTVIDIAPIFAQVIVDLTTKPEPNLRVHQRHLEESDQLRRTLGRHVFAMMPPHDAQP